MPDVLHPRALAETDGSAPHRVVIERQRFTVDVESGVVSLDTEQQAAALAEAHGVSRAAIDPGGESEPAEEQGESETCPVVKSDGEVCGRERPCQYHD